ncbi:MAG: hypothetical protein RLY83_607 [Actinomycetota bacterium]|jgi:secreted trypsin-like serine protease
MLKNFGQKLTKILAFATALIISTNLPMVANAQDAEPYIVGGIQATIADAPWQVALIKTDGDNNYDGFYCGGSLISTTWVVTAAHCVTDVTADSIVVQSGNATLATSGAIKGSAVTQIISHPNYSSTLGTNDIALIQLTNPVTPKAGVVDFLTLTDTPAPTTAYLGISGWGATDNDATTRPSKMRMTKVRSYAASTCSMWNDFNDQYNLCVGYGSFDQKDACNGDSGGGYVYRSNGENFLVAVVSYGSSDGCISGTPSVATKATSYYDWIRSFTSTLSVDSTNSLLLPMGDKVADTSTVTVRQGRGGEVTLSLEANGQSIDLGTKTLAASGAGYNAKYTIKLSDPSISNLGTGQFTLHAVGDSDNGNPTAPFFISESAVDPNQTSAQTDATTYFPAKDGYLDSVRATLSTVGSSGNAVPFRQATATLYVDGAVYKTCKIADSNSGTGSCSIDITKAPMSSDAQVTFNYSDLTGYQASAQSAPITLTETTIADATISVSEPDIYPKKDGFLDTVVLEASVPSSLEGAVGLVSSSVTIKHGSKQVFKWNLTKSGNYSKTWNGLDGKDVKAGTYVVTISAKAANGERITNSVEITVHSQVWKNKTVTKTYTGRQAFRYYESDDDTACTYSGNTETVWTYIDPAICYGFVAVPAAAIASLDAGQNVSVKATLHVSSNPGEYCGSFDIDETSAASKDICGTGNYTWNMGTIDSSALAENDGDLTLNLYGGYNYTKYSVTSVKLVYTFRSFE